MDNFNRRLISRIRVTEENSLRINILEKKRKRKVAAAAQVIDKFGWAHEQKRKREVVAAAQVIDKVDWAHKQKRKREVAAASQVIDKVDWAHKQAKNIVASIVGDTNPTAERMSVRFAQDQEDVALEQGDVLPDIGLPRTFLSSKRHSITTPEDLSKRWGLSLAQAALTLKATTQRLTRSALMPLARRYRADRMFDVRQIHGTMSTDTMDSNR